MNGGVNAGYSHFCAYLFDHKQAASDALCRSPPCFVEHKNITPLVTALQTEYSTHNNRASERIEELQRHRQVFHQRYDPIRKRWL